MELEYIYNEIIKDGYFSKIEKSLLINALKINFENISIYYLKKKLKKYFSFKHKTIFNKEFWIERGWNESQSIEKIKEYKKNYYTIWNVEFWIKKGYSEKDAKEKIKQLQSNNSKKYIKKRKENPLQYKHIKTPMQIDFWIEKGFTKNEANLKIKSFRKINKEYWIEKGFTEKESIKQVSNFQSEMSKRTHNEKEDFWMNTEYYIKRGYSEEEGRSIISKKQARGLDFYIKKYGREIGYKKWRYRNDKWKAKVFNSKTYIGRGRSKISEKYIEELLNILPDKIADNAKYGKDEKFIYDKKNKCVYKYDFTLLENKKIIEFNGDFWHGNPSIINENDIHKVLKIPYKEKWKLDNIKIDLAKKYGYDVLVIWEKDFKENKEEVINKSIKFLNYE